MASSSANAPPLPAMMNVLNLFSQHVLRKWLQNVLNLEHTTQALKEFIYYG